MQDNKSIKPASPDEAEALVKKLVADHACAGCGMPAGDVHMSTCPTGEWPFRVRANAAPAQLLTDSQIDADIAKATQNGAAAWAGVDPQALRTGIESLTDKQILGVQGSQGA